MRAAAGGEVSIALLMEGHRNQFVGGSEYRNDYPGAGNHVNRCDLIMITGVQVINYVDGSCCRTDGNEGTRRWWQEHRKRKELKLETDERRN